MNFIGLMWPAVLAVAVRYAPQFRVYIEQNLQRMSTLLDALQSLQRAEERLEDARLALTRLASRGLMMESDLKAYDYLRGNLFAAQTRLHTTIIRTFGPLPGGSTILSRVSAPLMAPPIARPARLAPVGRFPAVGISSVTWSSTALEARRTSAGTSGLDRPVAGFGALPVAAWAGIVIAVIGVGVLVGYALWGSAEDAARTVVPEAQAELARRMWADRERVYNECLGRGSSSSECSGVAQTIIPDVDLSAQQREVASEARAKADQFRNVAIAIGVVVGGFFLLRAMKNRRQAGGAAIVPSRVRSMTGLRGPRRVNDLHGPSTYNLEIA